MNFADIAIVVAVLFGGYMGFRKGLVIELCTVVAFVLGIYAGIKFSHIISSWILHFNASKYVPLIAFGICFLAVLILVFFIGKWLERFVKISLLKPIDRILGGVFGMAKYILIISVLLLFFEKWNQIDPVILSELKKGSLLYEPMTELATRITPVIAKEIM